MHPQSHSFPSPYTSALHPWTLFPNRKLKKNKVKKNKNIKQNSLPNSLGNSLLLFQAQTSFIRVTTLMYPVPLYLCQADALSPLSITRSFIVLALEAVVWHTVNPLAQTTLPTNVHCCEPLMGFKASDFCYNINTWPSLRLLSYILLLGCVLEIL